MLTITDTEFERFHNNLSLTGTVVVELTDGATTWLIGETDMHLTDGHVYPLLKTVPIISESVDIFKKNWSVSDVSIKINNAPYKKNSSNAWVTLSDEIGSIFKNDIKVYFAVGKNITQLSDMLLRYSGVVAEPPKYDNEFITVRGFDKGKDVHKELPQNYIDDSAALDYYALENKKKVPIVYGNFTQVYDYPYGVGLAKAIPFDRSNCVVSDHALDAITNMYIKKSQIPDICLFTNPSLYTNSSGYGRASAKADRSAMAYLYPDYFDLGIYDFDLVASQSDVLEPTQHSKGWNRTVDDYCIAKDAYNIQDDQKQGFACFALPDYASGDGSKMDNGIGIITGTAYIDVIGYYDVFTQLGTPSLHATIYYDKSGTTDYTIPAYGGATALTESPTTYSSVSFDTTATTYTNLTTFAAQIGWHFSGGHDSPTGGSTPTIIVVRGEVLPNSDGNDVPNDNNFFEVYNIRLRIPFLAVTEDAESFWVECQGREYGSWITSRSSSYASGDYIKDPAGIIESILRDELGVATADIDLTTFIDAENTSVEMRLNLHSDNEATSDKIIKQLCEQSTFAYFSSGASKHKLIPLNESTSTTDRVIPFSHIKNGKVSVSKSKWVINEIELSSQWQEEYERFQSVSTIEDVFTSIDPITYKAKWKNITGSSATHVASHLLSSVAGKGYGLWSAQHNEITFETVGLTNADLEVGDWIELDSTSVDPQVKCFGASWSGKQFLVTNIKVGMDSTKIKAIEI